MKIIDLTFLSKEEITRLGNNYSQMTLKEFTEKVESKISRGKHVKKECMLVYNHLCKHLEDYPEILDEGKMDSEEIEAVVVVAEPTVMLQAESRCEPETHLVTGQETKSHELETLASISSLLKWAELENVMKSELVFCEKWMHYEGFDLNKAIEKFIGFLKAAKNYNLNTLIPQVLYQYWFGATTTTDRVICMNTLALGFEGLLSEIDYRANNNTRKSDVDGLCAWLQVVCPDLKRALTEYEPKFFKKILVQLRDYRNTFAHGTSMARNSFETVKSISQFTALYTYTVVKYA